MKRIFSLKRHLIASSIIFTAFSLLLLWPEQSSHSQQPPPPPPVPVPLVPSVLEDIRNTKHNLSSIPPVGIERAVYTEQTTEICIFCHTPHGANTDASGINAPLWNRNLSTARYILYDQVWSTSFEGYEKSPKPNAPTGYSRLCLSCHDGTIALGSVVNPPGSGIYYPPLDMIYPTGQAPAGGAGTMPVGSGVSTGDTRVIGTNLQNDHPVSFLYDTSLALQDEELVDPGPPLRELSQRVGDPTPISPLRRYPGTDLTSFDSVQCTSCHNPHAATYPKFLRASYFNNDPADPNYPGASKILCLYCHDKPGWSGSAHDIDTFIPPSNPTLSNPYNYDGIHTVGQYACRACHDPHTGQGAKRLLREGVDVNNNMAIENTCYLCHKPAFDMGNPPNPPPDIRSEFYKDENLGKGGTGSAMNLTFAQGHEPVFVSRPQEGIELYSNLPPPLNEYSPGLSIQDTVHIECVDCHNPHQVTRTNRVKGMKGIDIDGNVVGAKIPGNSREPFVHEVCLRCHGNSYTNLFFGNRYPDDTEKRSNPRIEAPTDPNLSLKGYSNKRKEFDPSTFDIAPDHTQQLANPAYHPVGAPGRNGTPQLCRQLSVAFDLKDSIANPAGTIGDCDNDPEGTLKNITITCTDCHNNDAIGSVVRGPITGQPDGTSYRRATDIPPNTNYFTETLANDPSKPQGPHGSNYIRILRDQYNTDIENPGRVFTEDGRVRSHWNNFRLCFRCHDGRAFDPTFQSLTSDQEIYWTNFIGARSTSLTFWRGNLHKFHLRYTGAYCHECHYNVHSNVEATNTIYGNGLGGQLPDDSEDGMNDGVIGTHLINFAPGVVSGKFFEKPRWFRDGDKFRCDLNCHNVDMYTCVYGAPPTAPPQTFCAVGRCVQ